MGVVCKISGLLVPTLWVRRVLGGLGMAGILALTQGCATVKNPDARDPLESWNRSVFSFNDAVDKAVLQPVAKGYQAVTPNWFRKGVGNFFNNLDDVLSVVNNGLQGRGADMADSMGRVLVNTTIGLLGVIDVASDLNIERHSAGFGLTLGRWGVGSGPYLVLPALGPSTLRDSAGLVVDYQTSVVNNRVQQEDARTGLTVLNQVDTRAKYLGAGQVAEDAALDKYSFIRDAYLQRKRNQIYDGNPPDETEDPSKTESPVK